jgi:hypothetical protein
VANSPRISYPSSLGQSAFGLAGPGRGSEAVAGSSPADEGADPGETVSASTTLSPGETGAEIVSANPPHTGQ